MKLQTEVLFDVQQLKVGLPSLAPTTALVPVEGEKSVIELAREAGLINLAQKEEIEAMRPVREAWAESLGLAPLSSQDYKVWCQFLPTSYSTSRGNWSSYEYLTIPKEVLSQIPKLQRVFEHLEIRTPERQVLCPALFGRIGEKVYLLARWAESLRPFKEIREAVDARDWIEWATTGILFGIMVGGGSSSLLMAIGFSEKIWILSHLVGSGCFVLSLGFAGWCFYKIVILRRRFPWIFELQRR